MTRTVPGSGAQIVPMFNSVYGVREVYVTANGSGYDSNDPPRLRIGNCGTPIREAVLRPVIAGVAGEIIAVEVLDPGEGYDPLRLKIEDENSNGYATGNVYLKDDGAIDFIQMTGFGDNYFDSTAVIEGGGGSGAELVPITGLLTGLSIQQQGRNYTEEDVNIIISGGGGQGATGVASVNQFGEVSSISLTNAGEFFETPPLIQIIGGGGSGASAAAFIDLGVITNIDLISGGGGYQGTPSIIFTRDTDLIRTARNRQSLNSVLYNLSGILTNVDSNDTTIHIETTDPYPGSGKFLVGREVIRYTGKTATSFTGCDRGVNFRFDQKVTLDSLQDDANTGITQYDFSVTDKVRRVVESSNNRVAIVYDWDPTTRSLYLTFQVDELAFIDGGRSNEKSQIIAFVGGTSGSTGTGVPPHNLLELEGNDIVTFTDPLGLILNRKFEDDDELDGAGDGIIDLINTGTEYENQINLDGGIASSKYGIEETLGGQNTTLFQIGDQIYDGNATPLTATIQAAGELGDGDTHTSTATIIITYNTTTLFNIGEVVEGLTSGLTATTTTRVTGPKSGQFTLTVENIVDNDPTYKFTVGEILRGNSSGAQADIISVEYTTFIRNEED
ncbi:MAG: hypothetical protein CBC73_00480 [Flavobacteriales bacterium TMED113]|nr:MAG: hypothetical protein CBC73_05370 [Flavobacteriales bacterium TMED113]OUV57438.1 MAG: hypothetical protein CBC73_00480 [Flavobacteriales bacterium TMED113]|tara:strand:+ start:648 stop:2492 length:1845 start_codon:yes stop_codon:yes gene_type:complete